MEEEQNTLQEEKKNFFTSKLFIIGSISIIILTLLIYLTVKKWIPAWIWWVVVILALIGIAIFLIFKFIIKKPEEEPVKEFSEKHVPKETDKKCSDYIKNKILMKYKKEIDDEFIKLIEDHIATVELLLENCTDITKQYRTEVNLGIDEYKAIIANFIAQQ